MTPTLLILTAFIAMLIGLFINFTAPPATRPATVGAIIMGAGLALLLVTVFVALAPHVRAN